jgi:hypothetical protein
VCATYFSPKQVQFPQTVARKLCQIAFSLAPYADIAPSGFRTKNKAERNKLTILSDVVRDQPRHSQRHSPRHSPSQVNIYTTTFMAITEFDGAGGNSYDAVNVVRRSVRPNLFALFSPPPLDFPFFDLAVFDFPVVGPSKKKKINKKKQSAPFSTFGRQITGPSSVSPAGYCMSGMLHFSTVPLGVGASKTSAN